MAKGYWIAQVEVRDAEGYKQYTAMLADIFRKHNARYVMRGGRVEVVEGKSRSRIVVVEFPSYEAALACYRSPEYAKAAALRQSSADADLIVVEGYDGAQP
ncbi:MAG TPA: DUF1330 domain-containing protein [Pseudolabrys sp.]|jgi:uncharacterized protein (DUF1330 family)|nr:DUF1330 domain-containing protein [Pseudolabrys sp.]